MSLCVVLSSPNVGGTMGRFASPGGETEASGPAGLSLQRSTVDGAAALRPDLPQPRSGLLTLCAPRVWPLAEFLHDAPSPRLWGYCGRSRVGFWAEQSRAGDPGADEPRSLLGAQEAAASEHRPGQHLLRNQGIAPAPWKSCQDKILYSTHSTWQSQPTCGKRFC